MLQEASLSSCFSTAKGRGSGGPAGPPSYPAGDLGQESWRTCLSNTNCARSSELRGRNPSSPHHRPTRIHLPIGMCGNTSQNAAMTKKLATCKRALTLGRGARAPVTRLGPALGPGGQRFARAGHGPLHRLPPSWPPRGAAAGGLLGIGCWELTASGGGKGGFREEHTPCGAFPPRQLPSPKPHPWEVLI